MINKHPEFFQIEDPHENMSHKHEEKPEIETELDNDSTS
jgi:hypothetical protein